MLTQHKYFKYLKNLNLKPDEYVIIGSGVLYALGIKDISKIKDVDLLVTTEGWDKVKHLSKNTFDKEKNCDYIRLENDGIEIFYQHNPEEVDLYNTIKNGLIIEGFNFASLETIKRWKLKRGLPKDLEHIKLIDEYLRISN
jgi:predicted nucleotidyltransferase